MGALLEDLGAPWPAPGEEEKALPVGPSARAVGLPIQLPGCCSQTGTPPSSRTPRVAPPPCRASCIVMRTGHLRKSPSTSWLLSCAQHWPSCSENKGPEAPAEPRKAESSSFQSLLPQAGVTNTWHLSARGRHGAHT